MGEGAAHDWSSILQANYREFIHASEELRNTQLGQVAEQLASQNDGAGLKSLPSLVQNPAGEAGAVLPQFSSARLNDVLAYAISLQVEHNEAVAQWTLAECIEAWARNSLGLPTIAPQKQQSAITAAPGSAQPPLVLRSTVIKEAEPGAIKIEEQAVAVLGTSLPIPTAAMPAAAAYDPMLQHLSAGLLPGGQALPLSAQLPAQLHAAQQAGQLAGFVGMPQGYVNATGTVVGAGVGVIDSDVIGQIISEAARKEAAAAARAVRVAKRREEKQRKQERERKTKSATAAAAAAAPPQQLMIPGQAIPVVPGGVLPVVTAPIAAPAAAAGAPQAAEPVPTKQDKSELRAIKNRESAARSRAKRVEYTSALEAQVEQLRQQNKSLRGKVIAVAEAPPDPHAGKGGDGRPLRRTRTMPL